MVMFQKFRIQTMLPFSLLNDIQYILEMEHHVPVSVNWSSKTKIDWSITYFNNYINKWNFSLFFGATDQKEWRGDQKLMMVSRCVIMHLYICTNVTIPGSVKVLMSSSMANSQETARWQFCRKTQLPVSSALRIIFSAIGPWPWPNEMDSTLRDRERWKLHCNYLCIAVNTDYHN